MRRTQINLDEEQYQLLLLEAGKENRSLSDLVREAVERFTKAKKQGNAIALLNLAKNAVDFKKINPKVPVDLIENMDEYLYGKKSGRNYKKS